MRKPGASGKAVLRWRQKARHDRSVRANWLHLLSADNENEHAVRLARNFRSGSHDSDGVDRLPCRPAFRCRAQSRAAVRLHRRPRKLRQRHHLRHDQRRHCGGVFRAVLSQSPRDARLRHVGPGAHAAAGGDRCRHRPHHRPVAEKMGRRVRMGTEAPRHRGSAVGGARQGRHRHRAARFGYARGIHQPRLPRLFFAFRRTGRQQAALHRADVSRPRHPRLGTARGTN